MSGDEAAFARLVERHSAACLTVARQVLRREHLAHAAVREAYLDVWRDASCVDAEGSALGARLVMLTHDRAVDMARQAGLRPWTAGPLPDVTRDLGFEGPAAAGLLGRQTEALMRQLPVAERQCLMLAYWEGYTVAEIATLLDLPVGTITARCVGALRQLRQLIDNAVPGEPAGDEPRTA